MLIVADASPLRYLIAIGKQDLLPELFGKICVPPAVLRELSAANTPVNVLAVILERPSWLRVLEPSPAGIAKVDTQLDLGEREAGARL